MSTGCQFAASGGYRFHSLGKEMKQVSASHTSKRVLTPTWLWKSGGAHMGSAFLSGQPRPPQWRQLVLKLYSPPLAMRLRFTHKLGSCSQHIKVNRDASRAGNAGSSNRRRNRLPNRNRKIR